MPGDRRSGMISTQEMAMMLLLLGKTVKLIGLQIRCGNYSGLSRSRKRANVPGKCLPVEKSVSGTLWVLTDGVDGVERQRSLNLGCLVEE